MPGNIQPSTQTAQRFTYRCTTDKLLEVIEAIEAAGDRVRSEHFVGGRDWLLIVDKAPAASASPHAKTIGVVA